MRMWMVPPRIMCRKHLFGEHVEIHMLVGTFFKGVSVAGYASKGLIELAAAYSRHNRLAEEISRRGYRHSSGIFPLQELPSIGEVDREKSLQELLRRCPACKALFEEWKSGRVAEGGGLENR